MTAVTRILIADDYPDALDVWDVYLRDAGFEVMTAADGREALSRARESLPDLVVLDLEMPGYTGIEVARALRAREETRAIPLIASTGCSDALQIEEAWRSGFDSVLVKPCDPVTLVDEIRRLLAARPGPGTAVRPATPR